MTIVPTVIYCLMEGVINANSVRTITQTTADAAEQLGGDKTIVDMIGQIGEVLIEDEDNTDTNGECK